MMQNLPGAGVQPIGDHLEVVCLLQAAELERLAQYLEDFKLK